MLALGWRTGFDKTGTVDLLRRRCGYTLLEAKGTVDRILDGEAIRLNAPSREAARLHRLGLVVALSPGMRAPRSGSYAVIGPRGKETGAMVTVCKGDRLPPTRNKGARYRVASEL